MSIGAAGKDTEDEARPGLFSGALGRLIFRIDDGLRLRHGVVEFSRKRETIFRLQIRAFDERVELGDGTVVAVGDRIVELHLWNEHLPVLRGDSLRWARRMKLCLRSSLQDLAAYLDASPDLADIRAIRANMGFGTAAQSAQLVRISGLHGFESVPDARRLGPSQRLHRLGENILISLMVLARNGEALRADSLFRSRVQVFLSRRALSKRYAAVAQAEGPR